MRDDLSVGGVACFLPRRTSVLLSSCTFFSVQVFAP
eukprot:COSAG06_NODE_6590_length_2864_cov_3.445208_2_plen_36_part_00